MNNKSTNYLTSHLHLWNFDIYKNNISIRMHFQTRNLIKTRVKLPCTGHCFHITCSAVTLPRSLGFDAAFMIKVFKFQTSSKEPSWLSEWSGQPHLTTHSWGWPWVPGFLSSGSVNAVKCQWEWFLTKTQKSEKRSYWFGLHSAINLVSGKQRFY